MGLFGEFLSRRNPYQRPKPHPDPKGPAREDGLDLELSVGFASPYFVTDPGQGVAVLRDPRVLLVRRALRAEHLARFLAGSRPAGEARVEDVARMLGELMAGKGPSKSFSVDAPCFVAVGGFEPRLLSALKVLKLRGIAGILAVGGEGLDAPLGRLSVACSRFRLYTEGGGEVQAFKPATSVQVVSGLRLTVLSTTRSAEEILRDRPDLAADLSGIREEI